MVLLSLTPHPGDCSTFANRYGSNSRRLRRRKAELMCAIFAILMVNRYLEIKDIAATVPAKHYRFS